MKKKKGEEKWMIRGMDRINKRKLQYLCESELANNT